MAQLKFAADITEAEFPLLFKYAGRSVIQSQGDISGNPPPIFHLPSVLYCQDVLPTKAGYSSVGYKNIYAAATPTNNNFSKIFTVGDVNQNKSKLAITTDSHIYMLSPASGVWSDVTPAGWTGGDAVTVASANGTSYCWLAGVGLYAIDPVAVTLTSAPTVSSGSPSVPYPPVAEILGCFSSVNYLCLYSVNTIYWCDTLGNPLDFVPSLITGAGSAIPNDLAGAIVTVVPLINGYIVYTTENIILASFSNNTQFPWIFVNAGNGSGISSSTQVSTEPNLAFHVALTFAGLLKISAAGCEQLVPEVTDFIASQVIEAYDHVNNIVVSTDLTDNVQTALSIIGARYIVLSYAVTGTNGFTDALIYDLALNRWGKLHVNHASIFEFNTSITSNPATYDNYPNAYNTYPQQYNSTPTSISSPPSVGSNFGVFCTDGSIDLVTVNYDSTTDAAVLLLGKFQLVRGYTFTLQGIEVETINPVSNFTLTDYPSIDGKTLLSARPLNQLGVNTSGLSVYGSRIAAKNHILALKGSFDLTFLEITAVMGGRR